MKSGVDGAVLRLGGVIRASGLQHKRPEGLEFWGFGGGPYLALVPICLLGPRAEKPKW